MTHNPIFIMRVKEGDKIESFACEQYDVCETYSRFCERMAYFEGTLPAHYPVPAVQP